MSGHAKREKPVEVRKRLKKGSCTEPTPRIALHVHEQAMSFTLSVSYITWPVNPADLNDPSSAVTAAAAAAAAPRDGEEDKVARRRRERQV